MKKKTQLCTFKGLFRLIHAWWIRLHRQTYFVNDFKLVYTHYKSAVLVDLVTCNTMFKCHLPTNVVTKWTVARGTTKLCPRSNPAGIYLGHRESWANCFLNLIEIKYDTNAHCCRFNKQSNCECGYVLIVSFCLLPGFVCESSVASSLSQDCKKYSFCWCCAVKFCSSFTVQWSEQKWMRKLNIHLPPPSQLQMCNFNDHPRTGDALHWPASGCW